MTMGSDNPSDDGWMWVTTTILCPLPGLRRILNKVKYWGLPTKNADLKKSLRGESSENYTKSSCLQKKQQDYGA